MPLAQGRYRGYDFGRGSYLFTMKNGEEEVKFAASRELADDLEGNHKPLSETQRDAQFERLRSALESRAQRKFFLMPNGERPEEILLTTEDLGL
jgi:hypothetical protein